jgi:hypothetical protein
MTRELLLLAGLLALAPGTGRATQITGGAIQPHLAASEDGAFYAVFLKGGNVEFAASEDKGKTWSTPVVAIDAKGKAKGGMQRGPRIAVDGKKTIYVTAPLCFDEAEFTKAYPTQDLYLAVSTDGGKTFSKPAQINDVPKQAPEALHWLAVSANGDVFVAWLDRRQRGTSPGQDLAFVKITDQGKKIGKNSVIPGPLCECCAPGLSADAKGNPMVVYREGGKANRSIFLGMSTNGGASFSKVSRLNQEGTKIDACPMDAPAVAVSRDGTRIAAAWMDFRAGGNLRHVQWTVAIGGKFGPEISPSDDPKGGQGHPSLALDKDGTAWCAWEDSRSGPNSVRIYAADSKTRKNVQVSDDSEGKCAYPNLAWGGGVLGVAYEAGGGVAFRAVTAP